MALLWVSTHLIVQSLFSGTGVHVGCRGARRIEDDGHMVVIEIMGPDVPDVEEVTALFTVERKSVKFEPVEGQ